MITLADAIKYYEISEHSFIIYYSHASCLPALRCLTLQVYQNFLS